MKSITFLSCTTRSCLLLFFINVGLTAQSTPKTYVALKTIDTLRIDGIASEETWQKADWSSDFIDIEGVKIPRYRTRMKMAWDNTYLYFFAELKEPHIWGTLKQRDTIIFYNNDFEIFIDPDGDTHNYYEFEMNALNTVWDLFLTKPYRNHGKIIDSWDIHGLKTAVHIDGKLNDPNGIDIGWNVEIAIPWSVITEASKNKQPPKNDFWRINFSRVNWDFDLVNGQYSRKKDTNGKFLKEYNWVWSPQGVINMHEPEHWGYVFFVDGPTANGNTEIPKDEFIKWQLYKLYRRLLTADKDFGAVKKEISREHTEFMGASLKFIIDEHASGWNIFTISPFSQKKLLIKEDGQFEKNEEK